jgi:NAD(P)-dependent dehydrogenase (short-subunit alcohol dehydrogenase family)
MIVSDREWSVYMGELKTIVITGANSGIGRITALELAKQGHRIIMVCRNQHKGMEVLEEIIKLSGNESIDLMLCDLSSLKDVKRFCEDFKKQHEGLDVLINNAGVMNHQRELTQDGFELHFQVNYLASFLLTQELLEVMHSSGRIINIASIAHKVGRINFDDVNLEKKFSMLRAYGQSKLALILYTYELAERISSRNITVNCLHPGIIISNLGVYKDKKMINYLTKKLRRLFTSERKGAETSIYLASSQEVECMTGHYFIKKKSVQSSKQSYDKILRKKLWDFTEQLLKEVRY